MTIWSYGNDQMKSERVSIQSAVSSPKAAVERWILWLSVETEKRKKKTEKNELHANKIGKASESRAAMYYRNLLSQRIMLPVNKMHCDCNAFCNPVNKIRFDCNAFCCPLTKCNCNAFCKRVIKCVADVHMYCSTNSNCKNPFICVSMVRS